MSEELQKKIDALTAENNNMKQQIAQSQAGVEGLLSQLDAHREQLNESLNAGLNMRTNVIFLKKQNSKQVSEYNELKKQFDGVNKQLQDATMRIAELDALIPG
jgi:septal ring factor EnvC (AmiA/AmiB activator)